MGLLRRLFGRFRQQKNINLNNSQGILIRPDGSWVIAPAKEEKPKPKSPVSPYAPPTIIKSTSFIPGKDFNWLDSDTAQLQTIDAPPDYFPHGSELYSKLEQCLDLDIITSCVHKETDSSVYILAIELPCSKDHSENMKKFKLFIRAMEELYKFKTVQQERINSKTCNQQHYLVVFEYDPKCFILKKLTGDKKDDTED